ncbi:hypothetical protein QJS04_geneDACA017080 [Acorus gramineus]|uniref:Uncharacterized protein n=1 Tax=Acorus gramineus TaxID=55184 RepID=A0AAV9AYE3_ACOGR|nr:hypothetical protein QJS04_geneDACA017080 [Acorus gramineus]
MMDGCLYFSLSPYASLAPSALPLPLSPSHYITTTLSLVTATSSARLRPP